MVSEAIDAGNREQVNGQVVCARAICHITRDRLGSGPCVQPRVRGGLEKCRVGAECAVWLLRQKRKVDITRLR
ncbi:MAG TPA: hypothetical protein VFH15_01765, partial [Pyrinomonadaceae bacterium]|nr:hypothetical protein [Pyrinomonadaceae bacterium]